MERARRRASPRHVWSIVLGWMWSENAGWIDFAPTACGGDPSCGVKIGGLRTFNLWVWPVRNGRR
jgi:hypothetical protein